MELQFLDIDDVRRIYDVLVEDFTQSSDPIEPAGVRDDHLLEPAVWRQYVSSGEILKYKTPEENAATLAYGLCNNHPFFNGNTTATGKYPTGSCGGGVGDVGFLEAAADERGLALAATEV